MRDGNRALLFSSTCACDKVNIDTEEQSFFIVQFFFYCSVLIYDLTKVNIDFSHVVD